MNASGRPNPLLAVLVILGTPFMLFFYGLYLMAAGLRDLTRLSLRGRPSLRRLRRLPAKGDRLGQSPSPSPLS
jgi:hypothetical protein